MLGIGILFLYITQDKFPYCVIIRYLFGSVKIFDSSFKDFYDVESNISNYFAGFAMPADAYVDLKPIHPDEPLEFNYNTQKKEFK